MQDKTGENGAPAAAGPKRPSRPRRLRILRTLSFPFRFMLTFLTGFIYVVVHLFICTILSSAGIVLLLYMTLALPAAMTDHESFWMIFRPVSIGVACLAGFFLLLALISALMMLAWKFWRLLTGALCRLVTGRKIPYESGVITAFYRAWKPPKVLYDDFFSSVFRNYLIVIFSTIFFMILASITSYILSS